MSFGRYQNAQVQNALGQALAGVSVYFLTQPADPGNMTPLATIYGDSAGASGPLTQPLLTDGMGEFAAYLAAGVYTVVYVVPTAGTFSYPDQNIAVGGGTPGSTTFDEIGTGANTTATMVVGTGASLTAGGAGTIDATAIDGVAVTGTPGTGQVITATSPTAATWQTPTGGSGVTSLNTLSGALTLETGPGLTLTQSGGTITISIASVFVINSFTGGRSVELGASVTNPTFAATYSITPANANITNSEAIDSPLNLTSPFTSGTITGTFVHNAPETTTFQLTATQGATQTATQQIAWEPRIFGGVGTAGATSSVTASGTTAVLSTSDVLPSLQLGAEVIGEVFGPFTPSGGGQNVYLFLTGGSHTFVDGNGFAFPFNSPTTVSFVNANGVTVSMFLYQSTNSLFLPVSVKVAS